MRIDVTRSDTIINHTKIVYLQTYDFVPNSYDDALIGVRSEDKFALW